MNQIKNQIETYNMLQSELNRLVLLCPTSTVRNRIVDAANEAEHMVAVLRRQQIAIANIRQVQAERAATVAIATMLTNPKG